MTSKNESKELGFGPKSEAWKKEKLKGRLALYLCEKFTHEDLASSMAHLIIERSDFHETSIQAAAEIAKEAAQSVVIQAISAFKQHTRKPHQENYKVTLGPIAERSAAAQKAAAHIAKKCWDTDPSARIGDVADKVYRALVGTEHEAALPGSEDQVREWIREVAPKAASRPGRPRKKTP